MNTRTKIASIVAVAGLCAGAAAQDSVSINTTGGNGLPGDALDVFSTDLQSTAYVVDLAGIESSWGTRFGIAPIVKTSKLGSDFFNNLPSGHGISQTVLSDAPYAASSYTLWTEQGGGVNPDENDAGLTSTVDRSGLLSSRFAVVMSEFGGDRFNGILGAMINVDPDDPSRLYVNRINAAVNADNSFFDNSQLGTGSIDANGNLYFRADDFGSAGFDPVTGNNYYRTHLLNRDTSRLNIISSRASDRDATDVLVQGAPDVHNPPANIPADVVGGNGLIAGSNFATEYVRGDSTIISNDDHIAGTGGSDHRGNVAYSPTRFLSDSVGTLSMLGRDGNNQTRGLLIWDVDDTGEVLRNSMLLVPGSLSDNVDTFTLGQTRQFEHFRGPTAFRGSNGPVAVGQDRSGMGLAAGTLSYATGGAQDPWNAIAIARFDPSDPEGTAEWALAAWNDVNTGEGKPILDGPGGTEIGFLAPLFEVTGGNPNGPSISSPAFDAAGNIYFISTVGLFTTGGDVIFRSGLIRGIYNEADFGYELELLFTNRQVFTGANSDTDYIVSLLPVAGSTSVADRTLWSNSVSQTPWNNVDITDLQQTDPRLTAGIAVPATIIYDVDGDGEFEDPTATGGNPESRDEAYQVMLYIGFDGEEPTPPCIADWNGDGEVDINDFFAYLNDFAAGDPRADLNNDGEIDINDFFIFLQEFEAGC